MYHNTIKNISYSFFKMLANLYVLSFIQGEEDQPEFQLCQTWKQIFLQRRYSESNLEMIPTSLVTEDSLQKIKPHLGNSFLSKTSWINIDSTIHTQIEAVLSFLGTSRTPGNFLPCEFSLKSH